MLVSWKHVWQTNSINYLQICEMHLEIFRGQRQVDKTIVLPIEIKSWQVWQLIQTGKDKANTISLPMKREREHATFLIAALLLAGLTCSPLWSVTALNHSVSLDLRENKGKWESSESGNEKRVIYNYCCAS